VRLAESIVELDDGIYDSLQARSILAEALRLFRIALDIGVLELALHLLETLALDVDVKDTP
jgi:hypothetical protein